MNKLRVIIIDIAGDAKAIQDGLRTIADIFYVSPALPSAPATAQDNAAGETSSSPIPAAPGRIVQTPDVHPVHSAPASRGPAKAHPWRKPAVRGSADPGRAASSADAPRKRQPIIVEIQGKPGHHTAKEAAKVLGVSYGSLTSVLCKVAPGEWTNIKQHIVRRVPSAPIDIGEARPRHSNGASTPINPNIVGASARITSADPG